MRTLARLGPRQWAFLLRISLLAAAVECAVRVLPLPVAARSVGVRLDVDGDHDARPDHESDDDGWATLTPEERSRADLALRLVRRRPFNASCLRRSLVVGNVLRSRRPTLRVGVAKAAGVVTAHAWIEIDGATLDPDRRDFRPLAVPPVGGAVRGEDL